MSLPNFFSKRKRICLLSIALLAILLVSGALATSITTSNNASGVAAAISTPAILSNPTHLGHPMMPSSTSSNAATVPLGCPLAKNNCLASLNWGGYAACDPTANCAAAISGTGAPKAGSVGEVQGTWIVPTIAGGSRSTGGTCPDGENTWYDVADWVGIDGFVSGTVEQTGTAVDCYYGQAFYYAWYEFYPQPSFVAFNVTAGDTITAQVNFVGHATPTSTCKAPCDLFFTIIKDVTSGKSFTTKATAVPGAQRNSAEWISESAAYGVSGLLGLLALTQTNPVQFTSGSATINGVTNSIQGWGSNVYWLLMVNLNFGQNQECSPVACTTPQTETLGNAKSQPSSLSSGGAFKVTWLSAGP